MCGSQCDLFSEVHQSAGSGMQSNTSMRGGILNGNVSRTPKPSVRRLTGWCFATFPSSVIRNSRAYRCSLTIALNYSTDEVHHLFDNIKKPNRRSTYLAKVKNLIIQRAMSLHSDSKILIVGSGVFGLSTALWLARSGYRRVTVFDMQDTGSSGYNPGAGIKSASADSQLYPKLLPSPS